MNDFFLKIETTSKSGTVYRIYARVVPQGNVEQKDRSISSVNQPGSSQTIQAPKKGGRRHKKRGSKVKKLVANANSWRVNLIEPYIKETIRRNTTSKGHQQTLDGNKIQTQGSNNNEIVINEEDGVRLSILFKSISRLQKMTRIDSILANVRTMNREEAYYWYSKIFPYRKNKKGMKSFRVLFG